MEDMFKTIGGNIKIKRINKGLKQEQLAQLVHSPRSYISKLENGDINPTVGYLMKIASALDCSLKEFFEIVE